MLNVQIFIVLYQRPFTQMLYQFRMSRYAFFITEVNTSILNKYLKLIWSVLYQLLNCFCLQQSVSNLLFLYVCL